MQHIHLILLLFTVLLNSCVTKAEQMCQSQTATALKCLANEVDVFKSAAEGGKQDGENEEWEKKGCNALQGIMKCYEAVNADCRSKDEAIKKKLEEDLKFFNNDENFDIRLCPAARRIQMEIFGPPDDKAAAQAPKPNSSVRNCHQSHLGLFFVLFLFFFLSSRS